MLQETEQGVIDLLEERGCLTSKDYQHITGSSSLATIVLNLNRKFDENVVKERAVRSGRVTFSWNRKDDVVTVTEYYLAENYKELLNIERYFKLENYETN